MLGLMLLLAAGATAALGQTRGNIETLRIEHERALARAGPGSADALRSGHAYADALRDHGSLAEAETWYRSLIDDATAAGNEGLTFLPTLRTSLAILLRYLDRLAEAEELARRAVGDSERQFGANDSRTAGAHAALGAILAERNRYLEAEEAFKRALAIHGASPTGAGALAETRINYGRLLQLDGRLQDAAHAYRQALTYLDRPAASETVALADCLNNLAIVERRLERYVEADAYYRRSIGVYERLLGPEHRFVGITLNNLAKSLVKQGRAEQAEPLYARAIAIFERSVGREHTLTSNVRTNLAELLLELGRLPAAETEAEAGLALRRRLLGPDNYRIGESLKLLGDIKSRAGSAADAEKLYRAALDNLQRSLGADHALTAEAQSALARLLLKRGANEEASKLFQQAAATKRERLGEQNLSHAEALSGLALAEAALGRAPQAEAQALSAALAGAGLIARIDHRRAAHAQGLRQRIRGLQLAYLDLLFEQGGSRDDPSIVDQTFRLAQVARASQLGAAISEMTARLGAGGGALAQAAAIWSQALDEWRQLDDFLIETVSKPSAARDLASEQRVRARLGELDRAIRDIEGDLAQRFPALLELINPRPATVVQMRKLLGENEVLLMYLVGPRRSYLWAVTRERASLNALAIGQEEVEQRVQALRAGLDPLQVDTIERLKEFDAAGAHRLFADLVGPAFAMIEGARHMIVVPDAALLSLPFAALLVRPPAKPARDFGDFAEFDWLGRRIALSLSPTPGALLQLRGVAAQSAAPKSFAGFGAPALEGSAIGTRGLLRQGGFRAAPALVDLRNLRALPALPETAEELRAMAAALKGEAQFVFTGEAATETRVRSMDLSAFRVLAFSTHGLVAGEFAELREPALVLSPPSAVRADDDGLLTASEVATLRLNADWVILSACNTAAPDGSLNSEGLSGLAKAFFFAGSRALMVSLWSVNSKATVALTEALFAELARQPRMERAEALLRAQRRLMRRGGEDYFAHPMFWAAFALIGDGGASEGQRPIR